MKNKVNIDSVKIKLDRVLDYIAIDPLADLHIGDKQSDLKLIKQRIERIKNNPNLYCILNGDIINTALKASVSDVYSETISPMEQLNYINNLFSPIKDKILAITTGNHERRSVRESSLSPMYLFAQQLGLEDRFGENGIVLFLKLGELKGKKATNRNKNRQVSYTFYITHGRGGGRKAGSKMQGLLDLSNILDVDIYIRGHTHQPAVLEGVSFRTDPRNCSIQEYPQLYINTSATLDYGGYGQASEYTPLSKQTPIIYLNGHKKQFGGSTIQDVLNPYRDEINGK
jgi:predicted phosphodiesterase